MAEQQIDEYEHYNYDQEKFVNSGHSGKQRSKKEAAEHTNQHDSSGHTRKIVNKLVNTETNKKAENVANTVTKKRPSVEEVKS